jgi:hypothetical protein
MAMIYNHSKATINQHVQDWIIMIDYEKYKLNSFVKNEYISTIILD